MNGGRFCVVTSIGCNPRALPSLWGNKFCPECGCMNQAIYSSSFHFSCKNCTLLVRGGGRD